MSSSPQDQNQEPNQEPKEEPKDEMKEEVKAEEKQEKSEETREEKKEEKKEEKESWGDFIYNPRTGEFLGRTASSWGKTSGSGAQRGARSVGSGAGLTDPVPNRAEPNRSEPSRDDIRTGSVCVCVY